MNEQMNRSYLLKTIKNVLAGITGNPEVCEMEETASLREDIGLDSMSSLTFLLAIEDKIKFTMDPTNLSASDFQTIESICNYVHKQINS